MTSSNMCVFMLCLLYSAVYSHVIKPQVFPLPPEGVTVEIAVKNNFDKAHPIATMSIDINELLKKVMVKGTAIDLLKERKVLPQADDTPRIENRHGIQGGSCPVGYVMRGTFCFPDDDY